ncbi:hypothetical protein ACKWTF_003797 [Chironomus riparius]
MRNQILIVYYFTFWNLTFAVNDIEYLNLTCEASALKTIEFHVCECYKRLISLDFSVTRPVNNWKVDMKFFLKRGNKFFEIFKTPPIDWCKIVGGKSRALSFQKILLKSLQSSAAKFIHPCPYQGKYTAFNITAPKDVIEIFPTGSFKLNLKIYDTIDSDIANFNLRYDIFTV